MISVKQALISSGVLSLAVLLKFSIPLLISHLPLLWRCFVSWLEPPYVYVVVNGIIVTIAASSRLHHGEGGRSPDAPPLPPAYCDDVVCLSPVDGVNEKNEQIAVCESHRGLEVEEEGKEGEADEFAISRSMWMPPRVKREEQENASPEGGEGGSSAEKPLVSSRFGHHRRLAKLKSPEGAKALGVAKARHQETLENTWKSITEGRAMPLTRHLKKCDTWEENRGRPVGLDRTAKKSESEPLRDRTNEMEGAGTAAPFPGGKARKEALLSQDELNLRVEAFIRKFNEEMRLQRQESLNQYRALTSRGS